MTEARTSIAQRSQVKVYFDHQDMDFYLSWIMGRELYDGSLEAECLDLATRIGDGDLESWQTEWRALAERVEEEAESALSRGDSESARKGYLQACTYFRAPLFIMKPDHPEFRDNRERMRACFERAVPLFDPPIESFQLPYRDRLLTGYHWRVDGADRARPTVFVVGGLETFAEDCYFMVGPAAAERGYNAVTVDLPGQGVNPEHGLYFEARMEGPVSAALDYVLSLPETDADHVALFGFSWGGHIVFKGGQHDRRIKALIANPPMPDVFRAAWAQQGGHDRRDLVSRAVFQQIAWRMGLKISWNLGDIARRFGKAYDYLAHGRADPSRIPCPTLCLAGEGEAPITLRIARECYEKLPHPKKKLRIFTDEEGGEAHCQVDNLALPNGVMFDWLQEVFG
ncbi:MAG: alpha/beta hydrolase family protein [Anaerolineae bacterium]